MSEDHDLGAELTGPVLLGDAEVRELLDAPCAVRAVRRALLEHHAGGLAAPPRLRAKLGEQELVFTAGQLAGAGLHGFRAYGTGGGDQLVAVWDTASGALLAAVHGAELGPRRTGAIGAVAVEALARPDAVRCGLIGTGPQAWTQLWALAAGPLRPETVTVCGRRRERAERFAARVEAELGLPVRVAREVREAVAGQDVVIVATNSPRPVLEAEWVAPGTHLSTLGPKSPAHHEIPPELAARAAVIVTDSPAQAGAYGTGHLLGPAPLTALGAVLAGSAPGRTDAEAITLFSSVGLAGTEVAVAAELVRRCREQG
ncbi:ornithine cyclodeaminase family protein [Streptomyces catenulae]|uniref:NAD(P)-binding domain-containing protein n=1 Tax=Streptomyces catenulae TaxID=66875 RepID=A0ABV2YX62_9ACTN|nr:NAD(P)-binding domain-containing protein [Streptomyces catenulae]